jgi:hypothetical protein
MFLRNIGERISLPNYMATHVPIRGDMEIVAFPSKCTASTYTVVRRETLLLSAGGVKKLFFYLWGWSETESTVTAAIY